MKSKLERHKRFWNCESVDRPMYGFCPPGNETGPGYEVLGSKPVRPEDVNEALYQAYKDDFTFMSIRRDYPGDFFYTTLPDCGIPWYEALMGCKVQFSAGTKMGWAEKFSGTIEELRQRWRLPLAADDAWLDRLRFVLRRRKQDFGDCPVPCVLGRGILDLLYAALGTEEVLTGLLTEPAPYAQALAMLAEMSIQAIKAQLEELGTFHGGYANRRGLWAPGTICLTQEDGASLISPAMYQNSIAPLDRRIWGHFQYPMIHTHSVALGIMLEGLLGAAELRGIESIVDPHGPAVEELLPLWQKIQKAGKALLICSELGPDIIGDIGKQLRPGGLAFAISTAEPAAYESLLGD